MKDDFNRRTWKTPNTYDANYSLPPNKSGVYFIILPINNFNSYRILYIGSSKNLSARYSKHEVLRMLKETYGYVQFYFREEQHYKECEKLFIKKYQPKYNTQWL